MGIPFLSFLTADTAAAIATELPDATQAPEEAAQADPGFFASVFEKFAETPATTWIAVGVLVILAGILFVACRDRKRWTSRTIAFAALSIALSFVLSCVRLYRMPLGGSVTPGSMLPLLFFAAAFGVGPGVLAGVVYGALQYLQGGWFLNVWQFMLDYILAYGALGLAGLYRDMKQKTWGLYLAMIAAVFFRMVSATLAGYMFWDTAFWASAAYNGAYLGPEILICLILAVPLRKPVMRILRARS